jgi:hypothetical protein
VSKRKFTKNLIRCTCMTHDATMPYEAGRERPSGSDNNGKQCRDATNPSHLHSQGAQDGIDLPFHLIKFLLHLINLCAKIRGCFTDVATDDLILSDEDFSLCQCDRDQAVACSSVPASLYTSPDDHRLCKRSLCQSLDGLTLVKVWQHVPAFYPERVGGLVVC